MFKLFCLLFFSLLYAEEGMWPLNMVPQQQLQAKYGVELSSEWLLQVQKSCLRLSLGGSGSFVSSQGLILTNHHVGQEAIYHLSTKQNNFMEKGFYAATLDQELKCPGIYVDQLISIVDVTEQMSEAMEGLKTGAEKEHAQQQMAARLKEEYQAKTALQPQLITLYGGAKYQIYLYKRYTDIRLVFAPETAIAFFGGDHDNFEYPRYDLDICFFRAYENDKPVQSSDHLRWSREGPKENELLAVGGNPGSTQRQYTAANLKFFEDVNLPMILKWVGRKIDAIENFAKQNEENGRIAEKQLFSLHNASKALKGIQQGFKNGSILKQKEAFEKQLSQQQNVEEAYKNLAQALAKAKPIYPAYFVLGAMGPNYCTLYRWASQLVRYSDEVQKPNAERLKEYTETEIPTLKLGLLSLQPIYPNLETINLTCSLTFLKEVVGDKYLGGKSPANLASHLIAATQIGNLAYRQELFDNPEKIKTSLDPLIVFARSLDPEARRLRKQIEDELDSVKKESYAAITAALFRQYGETIYPDATFSLRLAFGQMKGYLEKKTELAPMTTIGGTFAHAKKYNFPLPPSWKERQTALEKNTTGFNFVSTNDIIGGNSGSPIFNMNRELVGLIFDGNIYSLIWDYQYDDKQGRAISVHSQAILETLREIYKADALVKEISAF
jgi:hypothetical protein